MMMGVLTTMVILVVMAMPIAGAVAMEVILFSY